MKRKILISLMTALIAVAAVLCYTNAQDKEAVFSISEVKGAPGEEVTVAISVTNNPGMSSLRLELGYPTGSLQLVKAESSDLMSNFVPSQTLDKNPYRLTWVVVGDCKDDGDLAYVTFKILEDVDGDIPLTLEVLEAFNQELEDVETTVEEDLKVVVHTYGDLIAEVPAACETKGMKTHYECSVCGKLFDEDKKETTESALTIAALGHEYGNLVKEVAATCETAGKKAYYECSVCGKLFDEDKKETTESALTIAALGHEYGNLVKKVAATCETAGKKAYYECSVCGKLFDEDKKKVVCFALRGYGACGFSV